MGAFPLPEVAEDPYFRSQALSHMKPTSGEFLKTSFGRGWDEGFVALKQKELAYYDARDADSPELSVEEATARFPNTPFDAPIKESLAQLLEANNKRKNEEQEILSHDYGRMMNLKGWGSEQAGNIFDPGNLALNFLSFGATKIHQLSNVIGRYPARAVTGTAEGVGIMSLTEPQSRHVAELYGETRSMEDSVKRVLSGALVVGGMHVGGELLSSVGRKVFNRADPLEIYRYQEKIKQEALLKPELLRAAADPRTLLPSTQRGIMQGTLAQLERGEIINAPDRIASLDDGVITTRILDDLRATGRWDDMFELQDHQLSIEEYALRYPEKVRPVKPLTRDVPHSKLVLEANALQQDLNIAMRTGKPEAEVLAIKEKLDRLNAALPESRAIDQAIHQQKEFEYSEASVGKERAKAIEKALLRGEPIPHGVMLDHPTLMDKYPNEAQASISKFEDRKAAMMKEVEGLKSGAVRAELQKLSAERMTSRAEKMSDSLVKDSPPVEAGSGGRTIEDANTKVDSDTELTKIEAENGALLKEMGDQLNPEELKLLKESMDSLSKARSVSKGIKVAAECAIRFLGLK